VVTKIFFVSLRAVPMTDAEVCGETPSSGYNLDIGRPHSIVPTSELNLLALEKNLMAVLTWEFFRNTASSAQNTTKSMAAHKAIQNLLIQKGLTFFNFYRKGDKPIKAVIRHLSNNTSFEDIRVAFQELGYEVISVKHMTAKHPPPERGVTLLSLPVFLISLVRNEKSLDIFNFSSLCNIIVKVVAYNSKSGLT
jgi:hypothetical protein